MNTMFLQSRKGGFLFLVGAIMWCAISVPVLSQVSDPKLFSFTRDDSNRVVAMGYLGGSKLKKAASEDEPVRPSTEPPRRKVATPSWLKKTESSRITKLQMAAIDHHRSEFPAF